MRRALSQPLLWISSPRERADTADRNNGVASRPIGVHWADESCSEDEGSPIRTIMEKTLMRARRSSLSPGATRPNEHQDDFDVGLAMRADKQNPVLVTANFSPVGANNCFSANSRTFSEKRAGKSTTCLVGLYAGHGGVICAEYLAKNLPSYATQVLENSEDVTSTLKSIFEACNRDYNVSYPMDPSGSSVMLTLIQKRTVTVAWTGDCRAVLCCGNEIKQLTWEHVPSHTDERKRVVQAGGLICGGQISGVLATTRGFGDNDVKAHFSEGVFIAEPSIVTAVAEEPPGNKGGVCFIILASRATYEAFGNSNEAMAKVVNKAIGGRISYQGDHSAVYAANKLTSIASKHSDKPCGAAVVVWWDSSPRSRSSSATSWRSLRSFSTFDNDETV